MSPNPTMRFSEEEAKAVLRSARRISHDPMVRASDDLYSALEACLNGGEFKHPQIREDGLKALARARGETT